MKRIHALGSGQQSGRRLSKIRLQGLEGRVHCRFATASNGAADKIQQRPAGLVPHVVRDLFKTTLDKVRCKGSGFGQSGYLSSGLDGVAAHLTRPSHHLYTHRSPIQE
jgi:hypothetical protein